MAMPVQFDLAEVTVATPLTVRFFGDTADIPVQSKFEGVGTPTVGATVAVRRYGRQVVVEAVVVSA